METIGAPTTAESCTGELERIGGDIEKAIAAKKCADFLKALLDETAILTGQPYSQVIQAVMTAMEEARKRPETILGGLDGEAYALWRNGAGLLAELKATEALDLLIANMGVTDGLSTSMSHFPVVFAVIEFGEPAIPKLEAALTENSQRGMRMFATYCLADIGGAYSKEILINALSTERDPVSASLLLLLFKR